MDRRDFLIAVGAAASAGVLQGTAGCEAGSMRPAASEGPEGRWKRVRDRLGIDADYIHLAGMLLAPHPDTVREAIAAHRRELDRNPALYLDEKSTAGQERSREAAARHMGVHTEDVSLTDSTTMGIGLVYNGLQIRSDQEFLTTEHDYHATHEAIRLRTDRTGASELRIPLFDDVRAVSPDEVVDRLIAEVTPATRVLAATWVHSSTGFKLPAARVAEALAPLNEGRDPSDRVLFCLDGVHGLGVEADDLPELGCDFFFAGTHKWVFGPRGTGVLWGNPEVQDEMVPTIPTFTRDGTWGGTMSPGGFKPFEHQWAIAEAFEFLADAGGKEEVADRIHGLADQLKEGLREIDGVTLRTPVPRELSSGIVCFEVDGMSPGEVVEGLLERSVIASVTPYRPAYARFSPGLMNTEEEMERTLRTVRDLA